MTVDLDKARAARREVEQEGPEVKFGGRTYRLAPELPFAVLEAFRGIENKNTQPAAVAALAAALMGPDNIEQMKEDGLAVADLDALIEGVLSEYGLSNPLPSTAS
jgi:hypothetical protein